MLKQKWILAALGLCVVAVVVWKSLPSSRPELHILCWTGYDEPQLLRPFEQKYGVKVVYKTFVGGDAMFALLTQSRGQYDVVVVDPEYIEKLHSLDRLAPLDPKDFNLADYVPPFDKFPLAWIGGKMYAIPVEFGANALVYNTEHITADEAKSYD